MMLANEALFELSGVVGKEEHGVVLGFDDPTPVAVLDEGAVDRGPFPDLDLDRRRRVISSPSMPMITGT